MLEYISIPANFPYLIRTVPILTPPPPKKKKKGGGKNKQFYHVSLS